MTIKQHLCKIYMYTAVNALLLFYTDVRLVKRSLSNLWPAVKMVQMSASRFISIIRLDVWTHVFLPSALLSVCVAHRRRHCCRLKTTLHYTTQYTIRNNYILLTSDAVWCNQNNGWLFFNYSVPPL